MAGGYGSAVAVGGHVGRRSRRFAARDQTLRSNGVRLVTSPQDIAEFWNVSTRPATARGGYGRSIRDTERCVEFFERALIFYASHGITTVRSVLTDNGSAYKSNLWKIAMREAGAKHRRTRPHTPRTNGKVERFNQTMKDEWLYVCVYISEEARREALVPFLNDYNHDRSHTSIGNRPPISRAPTPGPRLTAEPIVLPEREEGQIALDLSDNNVPGSA